MCEHRQVDGVAIAADRKGSAASAIFWHWVGINIEQQLLDDDQVLAFLLI